MSDKTELLIAQCESLTHRMAAGEPLTEEDLAATASLAYTSASPMEGRPERAPSATGRQRSSPTSTPVSTPGSTPTRTR